ncbi:MAG: RnfABCDGE type electron transport complex subunit G [Alkalispirochaeta sp.]
MKKLESTLPNMFIVLTTIALISAAALAFTYGQTKPILDEQARERQKQAVAAVIPEEFDNAPTDEAVSPEEYDGIEIYPARDGDDLVGTAVRSVSDEGYGGTITIMVGFTPDGEITGTTVLSHTETPGLGEKMTEESFREQFNGLSVGDGIAVTKDGGDIDAITAATITSRAFCDAINRAWEAVEAAGDQL